MNTDSKYVVCKLHEYPTISGRYLDSYIYGADECKGKIVIIEGSPDAISGFVKKNLNVFKNEILILIPIIKHDRTDVQKTQELLKYNKSWKLVSYRYFGDMIDETVKLFDKIKNISGNLATNSEKFLKELHEENGLSDRIFETKFRYVISEYK